MTIYTTGNVIKKGEMWCDDADEITQTAFDTKGYSWDDEWTIQFALETTGLGNALLALGAPLPRYKQKATGVEIKYLKRLYGEAMTIVQRHGFTMVDCSNWLDREDRKVSCLAHAKIWADSKLAATNAGIEQLANGMVLLYSADKSYMLRNVLGTRCIVTGQRLLEGEAASHATINNLKDYLRKELDNV